MAGSIDEAEDLVQETMMRAWCGLARLRGAVAAPNLAHRIATNVPMTELEHPAYRLLGMNVHDVEDGLIVRITSFGLPLMGAFDLPGTSEGAVMRDPRTR